MVTQRTSVHHRADNAIAGPSRQGDMPKTKTRRPRSPRRPGVSYRVRKRPQKPVADKVRLRMTAQQKEKFVKYCVKVTNDGDVRQRNPISASTFEKISDAMKRRWPNQNFSGHKLEYALKQLRARWRTYCDFI
ncbi:hypothetical protein E8E14_004647 [Neopestalotiopsis sp. 37M]|nr:hypothetical protein E8E14_004647 [Neopestalotiopsis sp. 37M]